MTGGANSMFSDNVPIFFTSLVQGLREDFAHPIGFVQIGAIGVSYLIAWLLARRLHQYLDKGIEKITIHMRLISSPAHFAIMLKVCFLAVVCLVLSGSFQKVHNAGQPSAHDPQPCRCLDSHSLCIFLHKEYFLVSLCIRGLLGGYIFADIQIMGPHR